MFTRYFSNKSLMGFLAGLILILAACAPAAPAPQSAAEPTKAPTAQPTQPPATPTPAPAVFSGLKPEDILIQLDYEPGFVMPEFRYPFGRTPYFTLLADGRAIYIDESQDSKVMVAQLSQAEAAALLQKLYDMGFARLESHTDMCGKAADGSQPCIADAATTILRVRMQDGSLREIRNYANFSDYPVTYEAIFNLLNGYVNPQAALYVPHGASLFIRIAPPPENASPADWPLDPAYVQRAQAAQDQFTVVALSDQEAAQWQKEVGIDGAPITFQLKGQPVSGFFVPWLPGADFSKEIAAEFH